MFRYRVHLGERDTLLAVSDEELVGRSLKAGELTIHITEQFYGSESVDEAGLRDLLDRCTVVNLMGRRCVRLATEIGLVNGGGVTLLDGVPHAQVARMRA